MISRQNSVLLLLIVTVSAMAASMIPPFSDLIFLAGNNAWGYNGPDIHFDFFIGGLMGLLCGLALLVGPFPAQLRSTILLCWTLKLAAALFIVPVYEYAYGLDIDGYFAIDEMPEFTGPIQRAGTWNVRMLAWLLFRAIGPSFHGGKVVFSFVGYLGIYLAYRGAVGFFKEERPSLLLLLSLAPTSLFWSASLGKDPLVLFGVGLYLHGGFALLRRFRWSHGLEVFLGAALTGYVRSYFLPIMGIPLAIAFIVQARRPIARFLMLPVMAWGVSHSLKMFQSALNIDSFDSFVSYQAGVTSAWRGGSSFVLPVIDTPLKLALVAPLAVFTALFRPTIFEIHNAFTFTAALDNTVLLVIFCYAVYRSRVRELLKPEMIWLAAFVVMWAIMYGVGTGNLGAISRFKIQVLPAFIILLVHMARKRPLLPQVHT